MARHVFATAGFQEAVINRIYLDHAATTPLFPEVAESMAPWLKDQFGNPSSLYEEGRRAKEAIDESREIVSQSLGSEFGEIIFTSSGTEAANLAVIGAALANKDPKRKRVVMSAVEHHCVLHTRPVLERLGYQVDIAPVNREALIDVNRLADLIGDDVLLVNVMQANNELGTIQPVPEVSNLARQSGALFHCDAVQTYLTFGWSVDDIGADLITLSAHKIGGPKGAGALYMKAGTKLQPLLLGGGQEREMRAGTESVANIVGLGAAVLAHKVKHDNRRAARDAFVHRLEDMRIEQLVWSVPSRADVLPGHAHLRFKGVSAESMLIRLDRAGVSASSGAACSSGSIEASHVLLACGYSETEAREGLRFSFGISSTVADAERGAELVGEAATQIRDLRAPVK